MPFISKDWRSPGEEWVKTQEGWEKKKILECGRRPMGSYQENIDTRCRTISECNEEMSFQDDIPSQWCTSEDEDKENLKERPRDRESYPSLQPLTDRNQDGAVQPHCYITLKCTREIAGFNGLSDALKRLDFRSAVHDGRRFHYICKLLDLLISQKLTMLSGCAQKVLFTMLEEVANHVSSSQQNIHLLRKLLGELRIMIDCACWGRPLGSTRLWEQHLRSIDRILSIANTIQIREPEDDMFPKLQNLPEECVREILLRLADHKDLENSSRAYSVMQSLVDEQRIWRELCQFHFTSAQIQSVIEEKQQSAVAPTQQQPQQQPPQVPLQPQLQPQLQPPPQQQDDHNDEQALQRWQKNVDWQNVYHKLRKAYGLREDYAEMIQLCRNCRCLFWKSIGHPCIADQDPTFQEKLEDVDKNSLHVPIPPQAFLKFFSL